MAGLDLQFLGELKVSRDDEVQNLPPSKRTRALLAYLTLGGRRFTREQLCELLWELPDDPRGSLRWSLSKLRRIVDDEDAPRIIADRSHVAFEPQNTCVDTLKLHELAESDLHSVPLKELLTAARTYRGRFLEGLELPDFHEFSAWRTAEAEQVSRSKACLLSNLVSRLGAEPEQALEFSRRLVNQSPYDKSYRAQLIRIMMQCNREKEAEEQYEQGKQLLREVGDHDAGELHRAWRASTKDGKLGQGAKVDVVASPELRSVAVGSDTFVGRRRELAILDKSFQYVTGDQSARCIMYLGEPGIGKSRLLECAEAIAKQANANILKASAFESEIVRPFALWNDALRGSSHTTTLDLLSGSERIDREQLFSSLSDLVAKLLDATPLVIIFDDMQWCDESSAAALHYVIRMNRGHKLWVVLGARDEEVKSNAAVQRTIRGLKQDKIIDSLLLNPLSETEVLALIEAQAPEIDSTLVAKESSGNPLLVIELARAVAEGNVIGTLNQLVNDRLNQMEQATIELLYWSAVLSPNININSLRRIEELDKTTMDGALAEAERHGILLSVDGGYRFSHDLVTRSIYKSIATTKVQLMHRKIAELMEADTALDIKLAAELARHASQSGDPSLAARSLVQAAGLCLRFYANEDAFALCQRGLEFVERLSDVEKVCLTLELKEIQITSAPVEDWDAAASQCVALAEDALDFGVFAHARLGYQMASNLRWAHGHWSGAKKEIMRAERITRAGSEEVHILGMAEAARCLLLLEKDVPEADAMLMEATARAERKHVESYALAAAKGMLLFYENDLDEAESMMEEARARAKSSGDRMDEYQANEYLCMIDIERDNFEAAKRRCSALISIGGKVREGSEKPLARAMDLLCDYGLSEQPVDINPVLRDLRNSDAKQRLTYILNRAANLDLKFCRYEDALEKATEALENALVMDRMSEIFIARVILAQASEGLGDKEKLDEQLAALLEMSTESGAKWARQRADDFVIAHSAD